MQISFVSDKFCACNTNFPVFTNICVQQMEIKSISDLKFQI
jgi:hypothetical protein